MYLRRLIDSFDRRLTGRVYTPVRSEKLEIRVAIFQPGEFTDVINVKVRTTTLDRSTPVPFEALSYACGTETSQNEAIVNGVRSPIGENLDAALRRLRHREKCCVLWIDALCINQKDAGEKNSQILLMDRIYSGSKQVLAWLGVGDEYEITVLRGHGQSTRKSVMGCSALESDDTYLPAYVVSACLGGKYNSLRGRLEMVS